MKADRTTEVFNDMPVPKAVLTLAIPTVISQIITVVYNIADTFFIARMDDPDQVAAVTVAMPVFMFMTAIANLFGIGGSSMVSRCLGSGNKEKAKRTSSFCVWTTVAVALLYGLLLYLFSPLLLPVLGSNSDTYAYARNYIFWTITVGAIPTIMNMELAHLVRAEGYSKQAGFGIAFGGILNIILDPLFIFTFDMKLQGAAIATMLSNLCAMLYFVVLIARERDKLVITPKLSSYTVKDGIPGEVLAVGLPSFIMNGMATVSNATLNHIVAGYSNEAIAGWGISKKIDLLAFAIAQGMAQGPLALIGYNYSAGNRRRMKDSIKCISVFSLTAAMVGALGLFFLAEPVIKCFINNTATVMYGQKFLRIVCWACPTTALNFMIITMFQATGAKKQPLILSFLRKGGLDIPLMLLLNHLFQLDGIGWATPLADLLALCVGIALFLPYYKNTMLKQPQ